MPLRHGPRTAVHPAVHHAVRRLLDRGRGRGLRGVAAPQLALPHEVFDVPLDALAGGSGLEAARATGVRHLVMDGPRVVAAAESPDAAPETPHMHLGATAAATAEAVRVAEALPEVQTGSYEVRLLRCAALPLVALWLHGEARDLLIPLDPLPPGVTSRAYPVPELLDAVRGTAAKRLGHRHHP
jgi:hypothetical protein